MTLPAFLRPTVKAAAADSIPSLIEFGLHSAKDPNFYILAWVAAFVLGSDVEHALCKLETAHFAFQASQGKKPPPHYHIADGLKSSACACGRRIYFVPSKRGKPTPVTGSGFSHFATCPDAKEHSRK